MSFKIQGFFFVFVRVCISIKRHHDHCKSPKGKHLIEVAAYSFRDLVHYCSCEHGCVQADVVLVRRVLHLNW